MVSVANPMIWLYLRIGPPTAMDAMATLWPHGTAVRTVSPPASVPTARSLTATTTLSAACSRKPSPCWVDVITIFLFQLFLKQSQSVGASFALPSASSSASAGFERPSDRVAPAQQAPVDLAEDPVVAPHEEDDGQQEERKRGRQRQVVLRQQTRPAGDEQPEEKQPLQLSPDVVAGHA